ncbi:MAG: hypothetical protein AAF602_02625 [Myxococcota bacterium]
MVLSFLGWLGCMGARGLAGPEEGVAAVVAAVETTTSATRVRLGTSPGGRPVTALVVPGRQPERRVLVIGGVHGSEQGGIEVAERMVGHLQAAPGKPRPSTVVVPILFRDHAAVRLRERPEQPTNRNFPEPGTTWARDAADPRDAEGRRALPENRWLVGLIDTLKPDRIVSVHGTVREAAAGIFADPHLWPGDTHRADARTAADGALALQIARTIATMDPTLVRGNRLDDTPTAVWSGGVRGGVSLGRWAPHPVPGVRESVGVLTVEVPGNDRSDDHTGAERAARDEALATIARALLHHVLSLEAS